MSTEAYEHALLRAAQQGDTEAYEDLQLLLEPDIRRFIRRMINDPFVVDDVLQNIFVAFYQNMHRIDPVENLRPYLFRIARNKCYDDLRRVQRRADMSLDEDPVQVRVSFTESHRQPKPDDLAHWMLLHLEVRDAIDQLSDNQRETLLLFSEEGLSYAEIADIMDVSVGTVKSRLFYAKKNLRGYLRAETLAVLDDEFSSGQAAPQATNNMMDQTTEMTETTEEQTDEQRIHQPTL